MGGDSPRLLADPDVGALGAALLGVPAGEAPGSWFDLGRTVTATASRRLSLRADRLALGYTGDRLVLRLGRQALSWGNGLAFQVLDLFNPFPPTAADTEYKPGTDMLWGQWLLPSGDDVQWLVVPRRDPLDHRLDRRQSSFAAKWHRFAGSGELDLLAARHFGDDVFGLGMSGNVAGGVWRLDLSLARLEGGGDVVSGLVNLDHSWAVGGTSVYAYAELYHNGFAPGSPGAVEDLAPALIARLERGEVLSAGRDELAAGAQVQLTPLSSLDPTLIVNLHDGSGLVLARWHRDLAEDLGLDLGLQLPAGGRGSEYGGLPLADPSRDGPYLAPGRWLWVRWSYYF